MRDIRISYWLLASLLACSPRAAFGACQAMQQYSSNGHWYELCDDSLSWHNAKTFCESRGGHLATITSATEQGWVYGTFGDVFTNSIWLGATDEVVEGTWQWVTGEDFVYTNWATSTMEPNNCEGIEHYLALFVPPEPRAGYWNDFGEAAGGTFGGCGGGVAAASLLCEYEFCGDGVLQPFEGCDDGNDEGGDGCARTCQIEHCGSVPSDVVSWWPGDGSAADIADGNDGTLQGGTSFREVQSGQGFTFDSSDDRVAVPHNVNLDLNAPGFTVMFWMRGVKNQPDAEFLLVDKSHGFVDSTAWAVQGASGTGLVRFVAGAGGGGGGNYVGPTSTTDLLDGELHHVAGVWDGADLLLYVDGVAEGGSVPLAAPANNTRDVHFAYSWGGGTPSRFFRGDLDEVMVFARALDADEIADVRDAASAALCKDCSKAGVPAGALCTEDTTFCNGVETCASGTCSASTGNPCTAGAECGNVCDEMAETCIAVAGTACTSDDNPCTDDECDGAGACAHDDNTDPCDDGNVCTQEDSCSGGSCGGNDTPALDCRTAARGSFVYKQNSADKKDKLQWKWSNGEPTSQEDLADPLDEAVYTLCVYDMDGEVLTAEIPPGSTCSGKPCWLAASTKGYKFKDKLGSNDGITGLVAVGNAIPDKSKITLKGRGETLDDATLPLAGTVTAQLFNGDTGICFESSFSGAQIQYNDSVKGLFKAAAP